MEPNLREKMKGNSITFKPGPNIFFFLVHKLFILIKSFGLGPVYHLTWQQQHGANDGKIIHWAKADLQSYVH